MSLLSLNLQRFSELPDESEMTVLCVIPGNPLLWTFLMQNRNLGIAKISLIPENQLFQIQVLPKTSVLRLRLIRLIIGISNEWLNLF